MIFEYNFTLVASSSPAFLDALIMSVWLCSMPSAPCSITFTE